MAYDRTMLDHCVSEVFGNGRFQTHKVLGRGAYGTVYSATDLVKREKVAVKRITKVLDNLLETKRICREIRLLRQLDHENVISLHNIFVSPDFQELFIVTGIMDTDLHQLIVSKQALSQEHVQYFLYQILRGILYIHSAGVIHRDLKPSNILVNQNCDVKICDFGLARAADPEVTHQEFMTEYVATRWYRAPEILLSWTHYTAAVDIWSVGCIFAELLNRRPLFPGNDYLHQITIVVDVLGEPPAEDLSQVSSLASRRHLNSLHRRPHRLTLEDLCFPNVDPMALEVLKNLVQWPSARKTAYEALRHPYFAEFHDPNDEPTRSTLNDHYMSNLFSGSFNEHDLTELIQEEVNEHAKAESSFQ